MMHESILWCHAGSVGMPTKKGPASRLLKGTLLAALLEPTHLVQCQGRLHRQYKIKPVSCLAQVEPHMPLNCRLMGGYTDTLLAGMQLQGPAPFTSSTKLQGIYKVRASFWADTCVHMLLEPHCSLASLPAAAISARPMPRFRCFLDTTTFSTYVVPCSINTCAV